MPRDLVQEIAYFVEQLERKRHDSVGDPRSSTFVPYWAGEIRKKFGISNGASDRSNEGRFKTSKELQEQWDRRQPLRRTVTRVICPNCKGHGVIHDPLRRELPCSFCWGDKVLEEVVELRRVVK